MTLTTKFNVNDRVFYDGGVWDITFIRVEYVTKARVYYYLKCDEDELFDIPESWLEGVK